MRWRCRSRSARRDTCRRSSRDGGVDLQKVEGGFAIKTIALELEARVPGIDKAKFEALAEGAKKGCPVSKALAATPITLSMKLL